MAPSLNSEQRMVRLQAAACLLLAEEAFVTVALRGIKGSQVILKAPQRQPLSLSGLESLTAGLAAHRFPPSESLHPP